jgi:hypothetical protein
MSIKRPKKRLVPAEYLDPDYLREIAGRCVYEGSTAHKEHRSWLGPPKPRRSQDPELDATICPLTTEEERMRATTWLQEAIRAGQVSLQAWEGGFPKHVWYREGEQYWFGFLMNRGAGDRPIAQYKGWPVTNKEELLEHFPSVA